MNSNSSYSINSNSSYSANSNNRIEKLQPRRRAAQGAGQKITHQKSQE